MQVTRKGAGEVIIEDGKVWYRILLKDGSWVLTVSLPRMRKEAKEIGVYDSAAEAVETAMSRIENAQSELDKALQDAGLVKSAND